MAEINQGVDSLGVYLTGGSSNTNPDASLGGVRSTTRVRGMGPIVQDSIPALRIDHVFPLAGEGDAIITVDINGDLRYTPPGDSQGVAVAITAGQSKVVAGSNLNKAIRLTRESGLPMPVGSAMDLKLVRVMNGAIGQSNVTSVQRTAGVTTYRALMLKAEELNGLIDILVWLPHVHEQQATWSIGTEVAPSDTIQTVADEFMAPTGITWVSPKKEEDALVIPAISQSLGLWIRRVFPVGVVSPREFVQLALKYKGV